MSTVPTRPDPVVRGTRRAWTRRAWTRRRETPGDGRRRCWPLAVTGVALLAISVVMMTVGA